MQLDQGSRFMSGLFQQVCIDFTIYFTLNTVYSLNWMPNICQKQALYHQA
jgi:hypothetical protein